MYVFWRVDDLGGATSPTTEPVPSEPESDEAKEPEDESD